MHSKAAAHSSQAHREILQDISHARPPKSLGKFKETKDISSVFSDHNGMKLEINYMKKTGKITNMW